MSFTNALTRYDAELVDLLARRPELRDVGIAGYLAGAAVDGAPGWPLDHDLIGQWLIEAGVAA